MAAKENTQRVALDIVAAIDQNEGQQPLSNPAPQGHLGTIERDSRLRQCIEPGLANCGVAGHVIWFDMLKPRTGSVLERRFVV
jgi:hypothetical protein